MKLKYVNRDTKGPSWNSPLPHVVYYWRKGNDVDGYYWKWDVYFRKGCGLVIEGFSDSLENLKQSVSDSLSVSLPDYRIIKTAKSVPTICGLAPTKPFKKYAKNKLHGTK